eukprot:303968-Rhodomonas_salina.1
MTLCTDEGETGSRAGCIGGKRAARPAGPPAGGARIRRSQQTRRACRTRRDRRTRKRPRGQVEPCLFSRSLAHRLRSLGVRGLIASSQWGPNPVSLTPLSVSPGFEGDSELLRVCGITVGRKTQEWSATGTGEAERLADKSV